MWAIRASVTVNGTTREQKRTTSLGWYRGGKKKIPRRPDVLVRDAKKD